MLKIVKVFAPTVCAPGVAPAQTAVCGLSATVWCPASTAVASAPPSGPGLKQDGLNTSTHALRVHI